MRFNENPESASCPFDIDRDGFVMSEGSACLVLESLESAEKRQAKKIYGEVLGYGVSADAGHITNPDGIGALRCMQMALKNSSISPDQISYINAHATSTPAGDVAEYSAIKNLFSQGISNDVFISSFKGSLGHLLGAAGSAEIALTLLGLKHRIIPASLNTRNLDPELKVNEKPHLKIVGTEKVSLNSTKSKHIALKNSFGFGGTNCSLVISSF